MMEPRYIGLRLLQSVALFAVACGTAVSGDDTSDSLSEGGENGTDWMAQDRAIQVLGSAQSLLAERFGGAWLETEGGHTVLFVAVVEPTSEDLTALARASVPDTEFRIVPVRYSERQLASFERKLSALISRHVAITGTGYSVQSNSVTLFLSRMDIEAIQEAKTLVPDDALAVSIAPGLIGRAT